MIDDSHGENRIIIHRIILFTAPYFGRGICLSDGRCLCWWGWTGPNACYVEDGTYRNRIIVNNSIMDSNIYSSKLHSCQK